MSTSNYSFESNPLPSPFHAVFRLSPWAFAVRRSPHPFGNSPTCGARNRASLSQALTRRSQAAPSRSVGQVNRPVGTSVR
jgi:hypothetical protein